MYIIKRYTTAFHFWALIGLVCIANLIVFSARVIIAAPNLQIQYATDDGFYYLTLVRHFSNLGHWTFDGSQSITSGFHLLHAYLLSSIYAIFAPTADEFVTYGLILGACGAVLAAVFVWIKGIQLGNVYMMMFLALIVGSHNYVMNAISIVEWYLVVLFAGIYYSSFYFNYYSVTRRSLLVLFTLGLLGSLSRSDFGLMPLAVCVASVSVCYFTKNLKPIGLSLAGLAGASLGLLLNFLHTYLFTGSLIQSSAQMKQYWSQIGGPYFGSAAQLAPTVIGISFRNPIVIATTMLLAIGLVLGIKLRKREPIARQELALNIAESSRELTLGLAAALAIVGYIVLYGYNGAIQDWYTANLIAPVFTTLVLLALSAEQLVRNRQRLMLILSTLCLGLITYNIASSYPLGAGTSPYPHQPFLRDAGLYLHEHGLDGSVGAWNAGIIGYYQGGTVVNLDGLVNNDIYGYAISNRLPTYIAEHRITHVVDFKTMLDIPEYRVRGGYNDDAFLESLRPIKLFDHGEYPPWQFLTLYRVTRYSDVQKD